MKRVNVLVLTIVFIFSGLFIGCANSKNDEIKTCAIDMDKSSNSREITDEISEQVFGQIEEIISQRKNLKIIDRTRFEAIKNELAFQQSDWSNKEKTAEIGKALNADLICFVTVYKNTYKVEFLNINTFQKITYNGKFSVSLFSRSVKTKDLKGLQKLNLSSLWRTK